MSLDRHLREPLLLLVATAVALTISAIGPTDRTTWTALLAGEQADAFLATQGDIWDTQWDMFLALTGSVIAQLMLSRLHDRQLAGVDD